MKVIRSVVIAAGFGILAWLLSLLVDFLVDDPNGFMKVTVIATLAVLVVSVLGQWIVNSAQDTYSLIKADFLEFREKIQTGLIEYQKRDYRVLLYDRDTGRLFNPYGGDREMEVRYEARNVLFSNKTINRILEHSLDNNRATPNFLKELGIYAAGGFADEVQTDFQALQREISEKNLQLYDFLDRWIQFDMHAGYGRFSLNGNREHWNLTKRAQERSIKLAHPFTAVEYDKRPVELRGLCEFIGGYLEGVVNSFPTYMIQRAGFPSGRIAIQHDVNDGSQCVCAGRAPEEGCDFFLVDKGEE